MPSWSVSRFIQHYAECRYAVCRYADCRYGVCRYADCRGVTFLTCQIFSRTFKTLFKFPTLRTEVIAMLPEKIHRD